MKNIIFSVFLILSFTHQIYSQWIKWETGTDKRLMASALFDSSTGYVAGANEILMKTTDSGENWQSSSILSLSRNFHAMNFVDRNHGWAVSYSYMPYRRGRIVCTSDGGKTWVEQFEIDDFVLHSIHFVDTLTGWAAGSNGLILKTTDGGKFWNLQTLTGSWFFSVFFINRELGWAAGDLQGSIYKTTDGGADWEQIFTQIPAWLYSVCFIDENIGWAAGVNGTIIKTTDGGISWNVENSGTETELRKILFSDNQNGWAVGYGGIIVRTTDGGNNWDRIYSGTTTDLYSVSVDNYNLIMITGDSGLVLISKTDQLKITDNRDNSNILNNYLLNQNYPNPFNPSTTIEYQIPKSSFVQLIVYDITGREVATIVNEDQTEGKYTVLFNGIENSHDGGIAKNISYKGSLASGIYFYRLKAGNYTSTKKMIMIK